MVKKKTDGIYIQAYLGSENKEVIPSMLDDGTPILGLTRAFWDKNVPLSYEPIEVLQLQEGIAFIDKSVFLDNKTLKEINLSSTLERIGESAFHNCINLKEISVPNAVTKISARAFQGCTELKKVVLPDSLTVLDTGVFGECVNLEEINIPKSLTYFKSGKRGGAFLNCAKIKSIVIPENVTKITEKTFKGCVSLEEVILHDNIKTLESFAFYQCTKLKPFQLPENLKKIGLATFKGCDLWVDDEGFVIVNDVLYDFIPRDKTKVVVPEGVKTISSETFDTLNSPKSFSNNKYVTEIVLPESLLTIEEYGVGQCFELVSVNIPKKVKKIGANAFANSTKLEQVEIPPKTKVDPTSFKNCPFQL